MVKSVFIFLLLCLAIAVGVYVGKLVLKMLDLPEEIAKIALVILGLLGLFALLAGAAYAFSIPVW